VQRSEWRGLVTVPKSGRLRYVPMTARLASALREHRHLRGPRVILDREIPCAARSTIELVLDPNCPAHDSQSDALTALDLPTLETVHLA